LADLFKAGVVNGISMTKVRRRVNDWFNVELAFNRSGALDLEAGVRLKASFQVAGLKSC
jgi:hypothetical protein